MNKGCQLSNCLHNTGEGSISRHHLHGAGLVLQLSTAYFGCRDALGRLSMEKLKDLVEKNPEIKAIELKMSQGAKPALGGILPKEKIAEVRGIPVGEDCVSPSYHTAFNDANYMMTFRQELLKLAAACGVDHPGKVTSDHIEWLNDPEALRVK